jgi:very-short-patch-repair endonuclease
MSRALHLSEAEFKVLAGRRGKPVADPGSRRAPKEQSDGWSIVLRDQIVAAGLAEPWREHTFHSVRGWRLDLAWAELKFAVEVDGAVHRTKERYYADIEKHNALSAAGWRWLRVTPAMVRSGEALELVRGMLE